MIVRQIEKACFKKWALLYNGERPYRSLNYLTPVGVHPGGST
jgi:hypothetical protein